MSNINPGFTAYNFTETRIKDFPIFRDPRSETGTSHVPLEKPFCGTLCDIERERKNEWAATI